MGEIIVFFRFPSEQVFSKEVQPPLRSVGLRQISILPDGAKIQNITKKLWQKNKKE